MFNDEELEDLLFAIHHLLESAALTPHGIKKYKYLEQAILSAKRGAHLVLHADGCQCMRVENDDKTFTIYRNPWCHEHGIRR